MSELKHTPGPWHTGGNGKGPAASIVFDKNGYAICDAKTYHGRHREGEAESNAQLISASPELLSALKDALDAMGNGAPTEPSYNENKWARIMSDAEKAIAKATK